MRLQLAQKEIAQFTQLSKGVPSQREPIFNQTAIATLMTRILDDLTKLSHWLSAITRTQRDTTNGKGFALQNARQFPGGPPTSFKLLPQIEAIAESAQRQDCSAGFVFGEVAVDFAAMEVRRNGRLVALKAKEFKVLRYLIQNSARVISREELLKEVWGYESYPHTRTVDNHIFLLRQKLETEPSHPRHFFTVRGAGYKFLHSEYAREKA